MHTTANFAPSATIRPMDHRVLPGRLGEVAFDGELPRREDVGLVFDELDYQMACQAYLWALPLVSYAQWQTQHRDVFGATSSDLVRYLSYRDRLGLITANATTPYILNFFDLAETGPLVIEMPAGPTAGGVSDFWQRECGVLGEMGPDRGQGGAHVVVPAGAEAPVLDGAFTLQATGMNIMFGFRTLDPDPERSAALVAAVRVYPYAQRDDPPPTRIVSPDGRAWSGDQPRGIAYWERLHDIYQSEIVDERDRFYLAMLKQLGIEKGAPSRRTIACAGSSRTPPPPASSWRRPTPSSSGSPGPRSGPTASGTSPSCSTTRHSAASITTSSSSARPGSTRRSASPPR